MNEHLFDLATPAPNKERPFLPRINDGGILGRLGEGILWILMTKHLIHL
jgi:hypothetical protein